MNVIDGVSFHTLESYYTQKKPQINTILATKYNLRNIHITSQTLQKIYKECIAINLKNTKYANPITALTDEYVAQMIAMALQTPDNPEEEKHNHWEVDIISFRKHT